ncbi:hypothetical protein BK127_42205 [Paenibacillus sp. FSL H7-0331]|nr:hypothetical protein BK127_42205 [Paenibacillus sp. FSL H7-0331]
MKSWLLHSVQAGYELYQPTYTLAAADKEKQKEFVESTFPRFKKITRTAKLITYGLKMKP